MSAVGPLPRNGDTGASTEEVELAEVLESYLAHLEAGRPADPEGLIAAHPKLARPLGACLKVMHLAQGLHDSGEPPARPLAVDPEAFRAVPPSAVSALTVLWQGDDRPPRVLLPEPTDDDSPIVLRHSDALMNSLGAAGGRYQVLGEIARGGMGVVFKARDADLGRDLALKVLLDRHRGDQDVVRRFVEEAQIGGQLQHPGIVPVHELGTLADLRPFFAMRLVKGRTLAALLAERPDPAADLPRFLQVFEAVCQTVAYAHARRVIHRDLKPANVMVGNFGEVQVMDWGLAKVLAEGGVADEAKAMRTAETAILTVRSGPAGSGSESQAGSVLGTPSYMAPEQARGDMEQIDERADVFGLGAILCEVLTGRPPYVAATREAIREKAARGDLTDTLTVLDASGAHFDLVALAKACLAANVGQRPRNAGAVVEGVTSYLTGVQERLRSAELARVEAQARAEEEAKRRTLADQLAREAGALADEERRRRRTTAALAASVLFTFGVIGAGWAHLSRQQATRSVATTRVVTEALAESERLRSHAQATSTDLTKWFEAVSAARRARDLLAQGEPDGSLQQRVDATLTGLEQQRAAVARRVTEIERDRKLLAELEAIRGNRSENWDGEQSDKEYALAFRTFGIDVDQLDPKEAGRQIGQRSQPIELASYVDDWALQRWRAKNKMNEAPWRRLLAAASAADPNPWRVALRDRISRDDRQAIRRISSDDKTLAAQSPRSAVVLAAALVKQGDNEPAKRVLSRAWRIKPDDFWVTYGLGAAHWTGTSDQKPEDAARYFSVAVAIRPLSSTAHAALSGALREQGKLEEAIAEGREAVRLGPNFAQAHAALGHARLKFRELDEAIVEIRAALRLKPDIPLYHDSLGAALARQGKIDEAIAEFRVALRLKPDLATAHYHLGALLFDDKHDFEGGITEYRAALRLEPNLAEAHVKLGFALMKQGKLEPAIAEFREAVRLKPQVFEAHSLLGVALSEQGRLDEALAESREAVRLEPKSAIAHTHLGTVLVSKGELDNAIAAGTEALRLKADCALAHALLGSALRAQGKLEQAVAAYREALRFDPTHFKIHYNFGLALNDQGKPNEAIAEYREAMRLNPVDAMTHTNLGSTLTNQGKLEEAIAEHREALRLSPDSSTAHFGLAVALRTQCKFDDATAEYRTAIRIKPDYAEAHLNLGGLLNQQGRFAEALAETKRGHELGSNRQTWRYPSAEWVRKGERLVKLDRQLPAIISGTLSPSDAAETVGFAQVCSIKKLHGASARLWSMAFQARPALAEDMTAQNRYNAACAAALAGSGQGKDDPPLDDAAKIHWRKQAIDWLKADLAAWSNILDGGAPQARQAITQTLQHWKADADLAGIRDPAALAKLPADEQTTCRAVWAQVDALVAKSQGTKPKSGHQFVVRMGQPERLGPVPERHRRQILRQPDGHMSAQYAAAPPQEAIFSGHIGFGRSRADDGFCLDVPALTQAAGREGVRQGLLLARHRLQLLRGKGFWRVTSRMFVVRADRRTSPMLMMPDG